LIAWHNHLRQTKAGGYRWGKRPGVPKGIENALNDPEWLHTVAEIERVDAERMAHHRGKGNAK